MLSEPLGLGLGIALGILIPLVLVLTSPKIVVSEQSLGVGRATIDHSYLVSPKTLESAQMQLKLGTKFNPRNYYLIRSWIKTGVQVEINDPQDPVENWIFSSRQPELVVSALQQAIENSKNASSKAVNKG